jgi:uncharacterized protein YbbK (DUF523 family)
MHKLDRLRRNLRDERGHRVAFVSHCLLDQNVRYLGGALHRGAVLEAVRPYLERGVGLCQLPCPERCAWGGVEKRLTLPCYGSAGTMTGRLCAAGLPLFIAYTRLRYRALARRVAAEIQDYRRAGVAVEAIVGVAGSPSCGVRTTIDLRQAARALAARPIETLDRDAVNGVLAAARVAGEGLFIAALRQAVARRGLAVPLAEHDGSFSRPQPARKAASAPADRGARRRARRGG